MKQNVTLTLIILFTLGLFSCKKEEVPEKNDPSTPELTINEPSYYFHDGKPVITGSATGLKDGESMGFHVKSSKRPYGTVLIPMVWNENTKRYQGTEEPLPVNLTTGDTIWQQYFIETDSFGSQRVDYIKGAENWKNFTFLQGLGLAYCVIPPMVQKDSVQMKIGEIDNISPDSIRVHLIGVNYSDKEQKVSLAAYNNDTLVDADSMQVASGLFDHYVILDGFTPNTDVDLVAQVNSLILNQSTRTPKVTYTNLSFTFNGADSVVISPFTEDVVIGYLTGHANGPMTIAEKVFIADTTGTADSTNPSDYLIEVEGVTTWSPDKWVKTNPLWSVKILLGNQERETLPSGNFSIPIVAKSAKTFPAHYVMYASIKMVDVDGVQLEPTSKIKMSFR